MDTFTSTPDPSPERRRASINRLRTITMGAAVAGLAGTTGFGLLAASGYTGASGSTSVPIPSVDGNGQQPGFDQLPGTDLPGANRFPSADGQGPVGNSVLPPSAGFGPGHATTGGT